MGLAVWADYIGLNLVKQNKGKELVKNNIKTRKE